MASTTPQFESNGLETLRSPTRCAVLMTSHDRSSLTVATVRRVSSQVSSAGLIPLVYLVDSSRTDDTQVALANPSAPGLVFERVNPEVYWAEGMRLAETRALAEGDLQEHDVVLWLNDDTNLDSNAIAGTLDSWAVVDRTATILVGALRTPGTGEISFSGKRKSRFSPTSFSNVSPSGRLQAVDTFNGNFVWLSVALLKRLGGINPLFVHRAADIEFGLRNVRYGGSNLLLPAPVGSSSPNVLLSGSILNRFRIYRSIKGAGHKYTRLVLLKSMGFSPLARFALGLASDLSWTLRQLLQILRR